MRLRKIAFLFVLSLFLLGASEVSFAATKAKAASAHASPTKKTAKSKAKPAKKSKKGTKSSKKGKSSSDKESSPPSPTASSAKTRKAPKYVDDYESAFASIDAGQVTAGVKYASRGGDPVLNKVLRGYAMAQPGNDYSFDQLADFITDHPDWPNLKNILMIAEQKIPSGADPAQIVNWFNAHEPLSLGGFYRYIDALYALGRTEHVEDQIRVRWINKDFTRDSLAAYHARFGRFLTSKDHEARLDRLVWEGQTEDARAMYDYVSAGQKALTEARMAMASDSANARNLLARVPDDLQGHPGLLFERLRHYRKRDMDSEANDILLRAPSHLGNAEKWWDERHIMARRAMERQDYNLAYRLAARHGLGNGSDGFNKAQAEFLCGWLALRFLHKPDVAKTHFESLLEDATTPITKARAQYWLGRVYEVLNQPRYAQEAYEEAAALNTTYYGQLAIARLYDKPEIVANPEPSIPAGVRAQFFARDSVKAVEQLFDMGEHERARLFFKGITDAATQRVEFALLMELAYQLQRPDWAIRAAKAANQNNMLVAAGGYPLLSTHVPSPPDIAFTHAVIRQESMFNADAGSPVGARGLMQLMPGTARDMAKKLDMPYSPGRLTDPDYNLRLGTHFMQTQIDNFNGSIVLALAGYNAGPRRVRDWMEQFGDPRTSNVDPIDWVEMIPIYETRNYVQRIIESYQFYRARLSNGRAPLLIDQDLRR